MTWQAVIAHAPGEEELAERLARPVREAGYEVSYRGTVLVGESFIEEAAKALSAGGPVILCGTVEALGTGWAHHLVNSARANVGKRRFFPVRMQERAYVEQLAPGTAVAEYWRDPDRGIQELLRALREHFPLESQGSSGRAETPPLAFLDRLTSLSRFDSESLASFRAELRPGRTGTLPPHLEPMEFLQRASLMRNGVLTLTGVLLFGYTPTDVLPSAFARFVVYTGLTKAADREPMDCRGTIIQQITGLHQQIASRIRARERVQTDSPRTEVIYEYPMRTVREIIANALVHREYEDPERSVHIRLFTDRIEVLSPGEWIGETLPPNGIPLTLGQLVSESVKRNLTLATVVAWTRLVEGEGSGLPTAIQECLDVAAPEPTVSYRDGFVKVTIFPRSDWTAAEVPITGRAVLPAVHQLPPSPADFVGREEELAKLREELIRTGVVALQGLGGVGKTALALKLAESLQPDYPDGQIFLNLRGGSHDPLPPTEAMRHVIRSYSPEVRLPTSESDLAALYRSVLYGKHALLLLDDAAGAEQINALIPPAGNLLLITSRVLFALPGLSSMGIAELPPQEARELLLRIAPRIGDHADEIASLCGYLPLALRLAGASLAERPDMRVQDYIQRLKEPFEEQEEQSIVAGSIRLSYDLLPPESRQRWCGLSVFPSSFDRSAAAAVLDLNSESLDGTLGDLLRNSMLEWKDDRYHLHPLLRSFAESRLEAAERELLRRRHAFYYLHVLGETSLLYQRGGEDLRRGLALFDREWENLRAGFWWTVAHSREDIEVARMCSDYPHAGAYCLELRISPQERIQWLEPALQAARSLEKRAEEAVHLGNLGNAYMSLGDLDRAALLCEEWLARAREIGDRHAEGQALGNLGSAYHSRRDFSRAVELFEQCLAIAEETGDRRSEGIALGNLANAWKSMGDLQRALALYEQRLAIAREIGDRRGEGIVLGNLGNTYGALGQPERALELFQKHLSIARELGDRRSEGVALGSLGDAHVALGDPRRALDFYRIAGEILREIGDRVGEAEIARAAENVNQEGEAKISGGTSGVDAPRPPSYPEGGWP